jgi:hypothetical protein
MADVPTEQSAEQPLEQSTADVLPLGYGRNPGAGPKIKALLAPLAAALLCTAMIVEALIVIVFSRDNGDIMVVVCPILGAVFLSIPAAQAWMACYRILQDIRRRKNSPSQLM